ncbi:DUF6744 family protein [Desulfosporosinus metallidurans]|uniref:Radical SAM domain protein n=1 Tax=Desulfosporosinus metallidurans TaxID=1888891 RepID=A0A1Q8QIL3_9FIRM|nr:DUF6744 family protein [Desulfosporosinus metallidurans]OLN27156.1 Radical SAM domain protein [Desulfosporosinus metallidurans]
MFRPIYEPRTRAKEYSDLAINIYNGCNHGCWYCYARKIHDRYKPTENFADVKPREGIVEAVTRQLSGGKYKDKKIMLCFTCDPYPANIDTMPTREVIMALKASGAHVQILTKGGDRARRDFNLLDANDSFGITLTCSSDETAQEEEPFAASPTERIRTLKDATAVLTLDQKAETMSFTADPSSYSWELCQEATRLFEVFKNHHNGQAVRSMVQSILKTLSPTPVRPSGGVYFVPAAYDEELQKLTSFCSAFPKGEGFKIQVVNSAESLKMVETKVSDHLESLYGQSQHAAADGSLSKSKLAEIIDEAKRVISGYKNYEGILSQKKDEMEARILLIRDSVTILMEKAGDT